MLTLLSVLLLVSSAAGGPIRQIPQREVARAQPACLNRYRVSAGFVSAGALKREKGILGARSMARREPSVK